MTAIRGQPTTPVTPKTPKVGTIIKAKHIVVAATTPA